jgi:monovalent cation/proton antiporter MnhG/PhaG subunit
MMPLLSSMLLVSGSLICLIAAVGVLRLPDFFMRMHAATKAGVAGCGLILLGVAFSEPSPAMWFKVLIALGFLLLTTPIAGHLLGRAGYVSGVPMWRNTAADELQGVLPRGDFDRISQTGRPFPMNRKVDRVVLGVAAGDGFEEALQTSLQLAKTYQVPVTALAIVDTKQLHQIGPVPVGGNFYARQLRNDLTAQARRKVANAIAQFERAAAQAGLRFAVKLEEGDPRPLLASEVQCDAVLVMPRGAWFDQGLASSRSDPSLMIGRYRLGGSPVASDNGALILYGQ